MESNSLSDWRSDRFTSQSSSSSKISFADVRVVKDILDTITESTPDDIQQLRGLLAAELSKSSKMKGVWRAATDYFQQLRASGRYEAINQAQYPDEFHIVLISYVLNGFFQEFNKATYSLKSVAEARRYPYKAYFKFLYLSIINMVGYPGSIPGKLYRGVTGYVDVKPGQIIAFQHFVSASMDPSVAIGYALKNADTKHRALYIFERSVENCTGLLQHPPQASNKEVLIWPCEAYRVKSITTDIIQDMESGKHYEVKCITLAP